MKKLYELTAPFILLVLFCSMQVVYAQPGLIGCYPLDNNANDFSGNNYNGTALNLSPATDRFGNPNSAYHFSGSGSYIQLPTTGYLINEFSYSLWCKPSNLPSPGGSSASYYSLIAIGGTAADQSILLGNNASQANVGFGAGTWSSNIQPHHCYAGALPTTNQWYHVIMTRTNATMNLYVNGVLICSISSGNISAGYLNQPLAATIGSRLNSSLQLFHGDIDDVRIFNHALTQAEVLSMDASCGCFLSVSLGTDVTACAGTTVTLDAGPSGTSFSWSHNGTLISGAVSQTYQATQPGQYVVHVNNGDCSGSDTINVAFNNLPAVTVSQDIVICEGESVTLGALGALNYQWSPPGGLNTTSGASVIASPLSSTLYTVTGTDANNCHNTASVAVNVNPLPTATVTPPGPLSICGTGSVTLNANTGTGYSYQWYLGNNSIPGATSSQLIVNSVGSYKVKVTLNGCSSFSSFVDVLQSTTGPVVTITSSAALSCQNTIYIGYGVQNVTLTANAPGAVSYLWSTGATTSSIVVSSAGTFSVTAWDASGCVSQQTSQSQITVTDIRCGNNLSKVMLCHVSGTTSQTLCIAPQAVATHLSNHSGDCLGPCSTTPRLIDALLSDDEKVSVYPNPFNHSFVLHYDFSNEQPVNMAIHDITGRVIESFSTVTNNTEFGINLSLGIYLVEISTPEEREVLKIMKIE
jgi:hypothetical protein